ncbi:unnamed protein product [Lactuca saligna]|uniref:Uncharacterized protein n=1 Tax=Lactuca saligna TaxID=75948 RepID=A0AA35ZMU2_LACSI|nr:unnamed protein product [Lactuca saligna]
MPSRPRFSTLASSHLASQSDSIIGVSSACEVQHPRLESPGFSSRLHYSGKLRMRATSSACEVQHPRLESFGFSARIHYSGKLRMREASSTCEVQYLASSRLASLSDSIIVARSAYEVQHPHLKLFGFSARLHYSNMLRPFHTMLSRVMYLRSLASKPDTFHATLSRAIYLRSLAAKTDLLHARLSRMTPP